MRHDARIEQAVEPEVKQRLGSFMGQLDSAEAREDYLLIEKDFRAPVNKLYDHAARNWRDGEAFGESLFRSFDIKVTVPNGGLDKTPRAGPLLVVSNHPLGLCDGAIGCTILQNVRPDHRCVLAHYFVTPEFSDSLVPVNLDGGAAERAAAMMTAIQHLHKGGSLAILPGGGFLSRLGETAILIDADWREGFTKIAELTRPTLLPVFITGQKHWFFRRVHDRSYGAYRGALWLDILNSMHRTVEVHIGDPLPYEGWRAFNNPAALGAMLRREVDRLGKPFMDSLLADPSHPWLWGDNGEVRISQALRQHFGV